MTSGIRYGQKSLHLLVCCLILACIPFASILHAADKTRLTPLKVALLPILDSLPFYVAEQKGYFSREGLAVRPIQANSAVERDQLMQADAVDGMLTDIMSVACFNRESSRVKIVRDARKAYPEYPLFRILAAPGTIVKSPAGLAGMSIGISTNTVIEYVTDRLLSREGVSPDRVKKESIPVIPERFQLLLQGKLTAATLPEPMARSAMEEGAVAVMDDSRYPFYSVSVLCFGAQALKKKPESLRAFIRAWDRAAADINAKPEAYRSLLIQKIRLPKNIEATYAVPRYPRNEVPNRAQWDDVMQWMVHKGLLKKPLPYAGSITTEFFFPVK